MFYLYFFIGCFHLICDIILQLLSFFVNSVRWNSISDEGRAALEMMEDEINSKRGPGELKLSVYVEPFDECDDSDQSNEFYKTDESDEW